MSAVDITVSEAGPADVPAVLDLVRRAYRGPESRQGWTTEADLLDDQRIDSAGVHAKVTAASGCVLVARARTQESELLGCCEVASRADGLGYFGMFAVVPARQGGGIGRQVLAAAEDLARRRWGARAMEMTVIAARTELIAWYARRGYLATGERRPFPYDDLLDGRALRDDLDFVVLSKTLESPSPAPTAG